MWKPLEHIELTQDDFYSSAPGRDERYMVPFVQVRGDSHLVYYQSPYPRSHANKDRQRLIMIKARKHTYKGEMSDGAARRFKKSLSLLIQATPRKWMTNPVTGRAMLHTVSVCTLTIGSGRDPIISCAKAKEMLEEFYQWLYHTKGNRLRVWKLELQKRGQPHFHLVFPEFIPHQEVRAKWNDIQRRHRTIDGYASHYKNFDPPSTEIRKAYQKGDIVNYLAKEMSKETDALKVELWREVQDEQPLLKRKEIKKEVDRLYAERYDRQLEKGKVWDCSEILSQTGYYTLALSDRQERFLREAVDNGLCKRRDSDDGWWYLVKWHERPPPGFFSDTQAKDYDVFLDSINKKAAGIYEEPVIVEPVAPIVVNVAPAAVIRQAFINFN